MIPCTESFKRLKIEQQKIIDFSLLVCHAIPNLKKTVKGETEKIPYFSIPTPEYFNQETNERLLKLSINYKKDLSKYILISAFSFFESYFKSVVKELLDFHGGKENYIQSALQRHKRLIHTRKIEEVPKLQEPLKKKNKEKYNRLLKILDSNPQYNRPSDIFGPFGIKYISDLVLRENFRSNMIPDVLEYGFLMDLTATVNKHADLADKNLRETLDIMRNYRNIIGHGNNLDLCFPKTMDFIRFLRYFSTKIDKHLVKYFFILERCE
jgi:hypothetical protein